MWCETLIIKKVIFKSVIKSLQSLCLLLNCICVPTLNKYYLIITVRQYDPAIIERTIGIVLVPFTALYRSFLKRCTLTKKAVGTTVMIRLSGQVCSQWIFPD